MGTPLRDTGDISVITNVRILPWVMWSRADDSPEQSAMKARNLNKNKDPCLFQNTTISKPWVRNRGKAKLRCRWWFSLLANRHALSKSSTSVISQPAPSHNVYYPNIHSQRSWQPSTASTRIFCWGCIARLQDPSLIAATFVIGWTAEQRSQYRDCRGDPSRGPTEQFWFLSSPSSHSSISSIEPRVVDRHFQARSWL